LDNYQKDRPAKHYNENIRILDKQLCELISKRKSISNNRPGLPPIQQIKEWADEFGLYENHLRYIFRVLGDEKRFQPKVEPTGFRNIKPVMKFYNEGTRFYYITHIQQYNNASVLNLHIDDSVENRKQNHRKPTEWELYIGPDYDCYFSGGSGSNQHIDLQFVISPRLPDDVKEITFKFIWRYRQFDKQDIGGEIIIN
jgi:AraC-like DNA-binding protein